MGRRVGPAAIPVVARRDGSTMRISQHTMVSRCAKNAAHFNFRKMCCKSDFRS